MTVYFCVLLCVCMKMCVNECECMCVVRLCVCVRAFRSFEGVSRLIEILNVIAQISILTTLIFISLSFFLIKTLLTIIYY